MTYIYDHSVDGCPGNRRAAVRRLMKALKATRTPAVSFHVRAFSGRFRVNATAVYTDDPIIQAHATNNGLAVYDIGPDKP